jgi:hypothetical protein
MVDRPSPPMLEALFQRRGAENDEKIKIQQGQQGFQNLEIAFFYKSRK